MLALSGSKSLGILKPLEENKFHKEYIPEIIHEKEISLVHWNNLDQRYILTAGLDNKVKLWNFELKIQLFHCARVYPARKIAFTPEKSD